MGYPSINNYAPSDYLGGTQNWRLDWTQDGMLFAANNDGLLVFDGFFWELYPLPNRTILRSVEYHQDTIFVGGQDELGYFTRDSNRNLVYHSLWSHIPEAFQNINDIWDIEYLNGRLYFRNSNNIFSIEKGVFTIVAKNESSYFMEAHSEHLWYQHYDEGVKSLDSEETVKSYAGTEVFEGVNLIGILTETADTLIVTMTKGIYRLSEGNVYKWNSNADQFLIDNLATCAQWLSNGYLAIGTQLGGLVVLDESGNTTYHINKSTGLQNNNVTSILEDSWSNVWVSTYYGIDRINFGLGLNTFYPDGELEGAVYDIELWKDHFWFATSNGLYRYPNLSYYSPFESIKPELVQGSKGQVWSIDIVNDQLLVGHNTGAFQLIDDELVDVFGISDGTWKYLKLDDEHLAIGCYEGIYLYEIVDGRWSLLYKLKDFEESSRILALDEDGNLWVSHPYRSVYKIRFKEDFTDYEVHIFDMSSGLNCENGNYIFTVKGVPIVTNPCGIFRFIKDKDVFARDTILENIIGRDNQVYRLIQGNDDGVWYISLKETGFIELGLNSEASTASKKLYPHLNKDYVGGFEHMLPLSRNEVYYSTNKGVKIYHSTEQFDSVVFRALITHCHINSSDRVVATDSQEHDFRPDERDLTFYFRSNGLLESDFNNFQYLLKGYDDEWRLTKQPYVTYNNLPAGDYSFRIRIQDSQYTTGPVSSFDFTVRERWYKTITAKIALSSFLVTAFLLVLVIPRRKYNKLTAVLINEQEKTERELQQIKEERLQDEIRFKTKELASVSLHLVQKKQTIETLKEELHRIQKKDVDRSVTNEIKNLSKLLQEDKRLEDEWERFLVLFDQVHLDFLHRLKEEFPQLTPKDQKLCAFLRMNMTTKEIAPLMNISVRGVEISRYRLRKKLDLDTEVNLSEFMINY